MKQSFEMCLRENSTSKLVAKVISSRKVSQKSSHLTHRNFLVHTTETVVDSTIWAIVVPTAKFS